MPAPDQNERLTAALRLVVAVAALAIFVVADPSEHPARRPFAIGALALFAVYGAVSFMVARKGRSVPTSVAPWIDVAWVTVALAVSQGTSDIFFPLYLFAILCASFWSGFRRGFSVAVVSALVFALVGAITAPGGIDLREFLVSSLYLLVLGYLVAVWGGHEVRARARLALLRDVTSLSNPRFGVEATVGRILEAVRAFFDADSCRVVVADELSGQRWMRAAARGRDPERGATILPPDLAEALLPGPRDATFLIRHRRGGGVAFALLRGAEAPAEGETRVAWALLTALEAGALLSTPFRYHASAPGRLYVARRATRPFDRGDAEFLRQVVDQVVAVLDNLRLVDRLASDAATEERRRIALDLHDSVIQPYLGLRLGLSAARAALTAGRADEAGTHVDRLVQLADGELQTLRGYVRELRADTAVAGAGLTGSVRRFCRRFSDATGIRVDVVTADAAVDDAVAAEVFQMVAEALSNVRRHTQATHAEVRVDVAEERLRLTVTNDGAPLARADFHPRSLAERAAALGGKVQVEHPAGGRTAVRVDLPMWPASETSR